MSTAAGYAADIEEVRAGDSSNEGDMVFSPMSPEPVTTPTTPALLADVSPFAVPDDPVTDHMDNTATSRGTSTSDVSSAISMDRERDCDSDNDSMNSTYTTGLGRCKCSRCCYGPGGLSMDDTCAGTHFVCNRCSDSHGTLTVCSQCYEVGSHTRHKRYLHYT